MSASDSTTQNLYSELTSFPHNEAQAESSDGLRRAAVLAGIVMDFLTCAGIFVAIFLCPMFYVGHRVECPVRMAAAAGIMCALFVLLLMHADGAYLRTGSLLPVRETECVLRVSAQMLALVVSFSILSELHFAYVLGITALLFPTLFLLEKQGMAVLMRWLRIRGCAEWAMDAPIERVEYQLAKRIVDVLLSTLLLLSLAPLLLIIAILIPLDSSGQALFIQQRVGRNGKLFNMYKFRSMHCGVAEYELSPTTAQDSRVTRFGRLLRRTSLDELPQLVNVFLGDMSLVGPRPEMPFIVERYSALYCQRFSVLPGITGLWQLSTHRALPIHENMQYDLYYIRNRTFFMDVAILLHTLFFAMRGI